MFFCIKQINTEHNIYLFQKVIQTIIQRYIFDIQREAEVTEGKHDNALVSFVNFLSDYFDGLFFNVTGFVFINLFSVWHDFG